MARDREKDKPLGIKGLLGLGFDAFDGKVRISQGPNFVLYGGSKETHHKMQETALKFNERVDVRGKKLEDINRRELDEIVKEVGEESC